MRKGKERYRPTFLACTLANKVIGGDLLETVHTGANPTFSATGRFEGGKSAETREGIPVVWSYGFRDDKQRGLILVNLDTAKAHTVAVRFAGAAAKPAAESWLLSAESLTAYNEWEVAEPRVKVTERALTPFASGAQVPLPPFSMTALRWEVE